MHALPHPRFTGNEGNSDAAAREAAEAAAKEAATAAALPPPPPLKVADLVPEIAAASAAVGHTASHHFFGRLPLLSPSSTPHVPPTPPTYLPISSPSHTVSLPIA